MKTVPLPPPLRSIRHPLTGVETMVHDTRDIEATRKFVDESIAMIQSHRPERTARQPLVKSFQAPVATTTKATAAAKAAHPAVAVVRGSSAVSATFTAPPRK